MNDDALFCSKCGTKVEEVTNNNNEEVVEQKVEKVNANNENKEVIEQKEEAKPVEAPKANAKIKAKATPIYEQKIKEFLPISLAIIVSSIVVWIINGVAHPSGIGKIMPLLLFMLFTGGYAAISMVRAVKTLTRKIYYKSALSFVLFVLLVVCFIINFVYLVS